MALRKARMLDDRDLYPASGGVPMEDVKHPLNAHCLRETLEDWLHSQGRDVWAAVDNFVYYERGNPKGNVGPDFYVILDVPEDPERDCWRAWNEGGRLPDVVVEFTSKSSRHKDRVKKFAIYRDILHVSNYFIVDVRRIVLDGWELRQQEYQPLAPNVHGRLWCAALGLWVGWHEGLLRWFDDTGNRLPTRKEGAQAAQERAVQAEAEIARLRAEINRLKNS